MSKINLNEAQETALKEIINAFYSGKKKYLLTGHAGTGKTFLMQCVVSAMNEDSISVCVTAPTHKAVSVLASKMNHMDAKICTIHSLLGLRPAHEGEKSHLKRSGKSMASFYKLVIIDECSMISSDLQDYIDNDLERNFVLYVGDPAQLPPVNEVEAICFQIEDRSHLHTIVRQEEGNPILEAATAIREQQGKRADWSWCRTVERGPHGVFLAGHDADAWMREAFTSEAFKADNDAFRYLCWTNARVAEVNRKVRRWVYGETKTPYVEGERVLIRAPILSSSGGLAFSTNDEAIVQDIELISHNFSFKEHLNGKNDQSLPEWDVDIECWSINLRHDGLGAVRVMVPRYEAQRQNIDQKLVQEAKIHSGRWYERFQFIEALAKLQACFALTTHTSQGSTFDNVFIDIPDIRKREISNELECQQMCYVAVTRARFASILIGR